MKLKHLILFLILFITCISNAQSTKSSTKSGPKRNYPSIIHQVMVSYSKGQTVTPEVLLSAIPETKEEFLTYYHYTYTEQEKAFQKTFYKVDQAFIKYATANHSDFLRRYLELSSFVDGEYAEGYQDDVSGVISKNKAAFCKIYPKLSPGSKKFLQKFKTKYCNQK